MAHSESDVGPALDISDVLRKGLEKVALQQQSYLMAPRMRAILTTPADGTQPKNKPDLRAVLRIWAGRGQFRRLCMPSPIGRVSDLQWFQAG